MDRESLTLTKRLRRSVRMGVAIVLALLVGGALLDMVGLTGGGKVMAAKLPAPSHSTTIPSTRRIADSSW